MPELNNKKKNAVKLFESEQKRWKWDRTNSDEYRECGRTFQLKIKIAAFIPSAICVRAFSGYRRAH